jgi:uracil-DNA glycosylase
MKIDIHPTWETELATEFNKEYFKELLAFVDSERSGHDVFPGEQDVFNALQLTPYPKVKAVILGQDPYHNHDQAHGLAFSVKDGIKHPPSLRNIFKELHSDLEIDTPVGGNLSEWAERGVLLLNTVLTVRAHNANSHQKKGWENFTDAVIQSIGSREQHTVFILWGKPAAKKTSLIDATRHTILTAPHPSPLSAHRGFFDSKPFSKTNDALHQNNQAAIDWRLE